MPRTEETLTSFALNDKKQQKTTENKQTNERATRTDLVPERDAVEEEIVLLPLVVRVNIVRIGTLLHQKHRHLLKVALHAPTTHMTIK